MANGAVVTTTEITHTVLKKITFAWTSGGAADDDAGAAAATTTKAYDGLVVGLTTIPSGTAAPTDDYDVAITDADGHDILLGQGANRDTATTEHVAASMSGVAGSKLSLAVTNAGNEKSGTVIVWIR